MLPYVSLLWTTFSIRRPARVCCCWRPFSCVIVMTSAPEASVSAAYTGSQYAKRVGDGLDDLGLRLQRFLEIASGIRIGLAFRLRTPQVVIRSDVGDMLPERAHLLLRTRPQPVGLFGHALRDAKHAVLVAVIKVAQEACDRRRSLRWPCWAAAGTAIAKSSKVVERTRFIMRRFYKTTHVVRVVTLRLDYSACDASAASPSTPSPRQRNIARGPRPPQAQVPTFPWCPPVKTMSTRRGDGWVSR